MENNGENNGPLSSLPANRLTATNCNADRLYQLIALVFRKYQPRETEAIAKIGEIQFVTWGCR